MRAAPTLPGFEDDAPRKPAGGYRLIPVLLLVMAWWCYRAKRIRLADLRAYFACHEMAARRCLSRQAGFPAHFTTAELARLAGTTQRRARASLHRLEAAGLLRWAEDEIGFAGSPEALHAEDLAGFWAMFEKIRNRKRQIPVPRRILRLMAGGARPALIATILGLLCRCLYRRGGRLRARGRCKASWIADTFGVDLRRVKAARRELIALGWLLPARSAQWSLNRWGRLYHINLAWDRRREGTAAPASTPDTGRELPPPPAAFAPELPPPDSHREPVKDDKHQKPALGGPSGVCIPAPMQEEPAVTAPAPALPPAAALPTSPPVAGPPPAPLPEPTLRDVRIEDLKDTGRTLELHRQAVAAGLVTGSEADRLRFVAAAEHARAIGTTNPCGLFVRLVRGRLWAFLTGADEDAANARLKRHLHGAPRPPSGTPPAPAPRPVLSPDARLVAAVLGAARQSGYRGDAFYLLKREHPEWSRERWARAVAELGGARAGSGRVRPVRRCWGRCCRRWGDQACLGHQPHQLVVLGQVERRLGVEGERVAVPVLPVDDGAEDRLRGLLVSEVRRP
ncbi:MAG: hypothetical protein JO122_11470 [Acetobacteraceae bacterium]|nr:hypothetical protein [Acetobacteraceae bacterium]